MDVTEERICELEDIPIKIIQNEEYVEIKKTGKQK